MSEEKTITEKVNKEKTKVVSEKKESTKVPKKFESIVKEIEGMSALDLHELVKVFEDKFDVSASAVMQAPVQTEGGDDDTESGIVTITLEEVGDNKIQVIKAVKEVLGLGLKEAKDLVDSAPKVIKEEVIAEEAKTIQKQFEGIGAKVSLK